jgi:hypothetical protein
MAGEEAPHLHAVGPHEGNVTAVVFNYSLDVQP